MRRIIFIFAIISLLLAACQTATPQASPESDAGAEPTAATLAATAPVKGSDNATGIPASTAAPADLEPVSADSPGCTVQSPFPTPGPTEQSLFPPVGDRDWVTGPSSAQVTFTEYSDFQ